MQLTISPEVGALLEQQLATGRFQDANEFITIAVGMMADLVPLDSVQFRAELDESLAQIESGETYSEEEARAYIREVRSRL